jgi:hypothetical protein
MYNLNFVFIVNVHRIVKGEDALLIRSRGSDESAYPILSL